MCFWCSVPIFYSCFVFVWWGFPYSTMYKRGYCGYAPVNVEYNVPATTSEVISDIYFQVVNWWCIYIRICIYTYIHTLHDITLHYITLPYITLQYSTLHYITLHSIPFHSYIHIYIYINIYVHTYWFIHRIPFGSCKDTWISPVQESRILLHPSAADHLRGTTVWYPIIHIIPHSSSLL